MWNDVDNRLPVEDGHYLIQTRTGLNTREFKNGKWQEKYSDYPTISWDDDNGRVPSYPSGHAANSARVMAKYLPRTTLIARTPDVEYISNPSPPVNVPFTTVELKTVDVINAFLGLQRQAMEQARKERKKSAFNKIRNMITF